MTARGDELPNPSRVVRYVPFGRMRRDDFENCLGPNPNAFEQRAVDDYLSVTWCEYFVGNVDAQLRCAVEAIRSSKINVKAMACFCVADAPDVLSAIRSAGHPGRTVYLPEEDNPAHAGVCGIPPDDAQLLARLAEEIWSTFLTKDAADHLPISACAKSVTVR